MSGVEVAGIALAILPLLIEAVKGYSKISERLHAFRHYSKEIEAILARFKIQRGIFLNECRLLLNLGLEDRRTKDMVENTSDKRWTSKALDETLIDCLKENFDLCKSIIEFSTAILDEIGTELAKFDGVVERKEDHGPPKAAKRHLRNSIRILFERSKYEKALINLRERNLELNQLRSHIVEFEHRDSNHTLTSPQMGKLSPVNFAAVQKAAQKLHEALCRACWNGVSTSNPHNARICLEARVQSEVQLDLAISCNGKCSQDTQMSISAGCPIWLCVQSINIEANKGIASDPTMLLNQPTQPDFPAASTSIASTLTYRPSLTCSKANGKMRATHYLAAEKEDNSTAIDQKDTVEPLRKGTKITTESIYCEVNLYQTRSFCDYIKQNLHLCRKDLGNRYIGYLETPNMFKHIFYLEDQRNMRIIASGETIANSIHPVSDLMKQSIDGTLTIIDQLRLAQKVALATLQFNQTPWLAEKWQLEDLCYYGLPDAFDEDCLKTLHLSAHIPMLEDTQSSCRTTDPTHSEELLFGINNTTLFSLGVALLELGHWKPLTSFNGAADQNPIVTARTLANRPTPLGPKYQDIIRRLLQCNFGFGTDLNRSELQAAVYDGVVCQLGRMIESLSI